MGPAIEDNTEAELSAASPDESDVAVLSSGPVPEPGIGGAPVRCTFLATRSRARFLGGSFDELTVLCLCGVNGTDGFSRVRCTYFSSRFVAGLLGRKACFAVFHMLNPCLSFQGRPNGTVYQVSRLDIFPSSAFVGTDAGDSVGLCLSQKNMTPASSEPARVFSAPHPRT
jgi:hypothetical protein